MIFASPEWTPTKVGVFFIRTIQTASEERMHLSLLLTQFINGLQTGSIYALVALGYSMVYGIILLLNFAHGDVIMIGAYRLFYAFV